MAAAFGIDHKRLALLFSGVCGALAGIAGVCLALSYTLTPAQIYAWVGVVFAAVMLGGLGSPVGPLVAGIVIGVSEALTAAIASPSGRRSSVHALIVILLVRPGRTEARLVHCRHRRRRGALAPTGAAPARVLRMFLYLVPWIVSPRRNRRSGTRAALLDTAFFGAGVYTTPCSGSTTCRSCGRRRRPDDSRGPGHRARRDVLPCARAASSSRKYGRIVVLATVVLNSPIDGGPGVYLSAVAVPALAPTPSGTFYLLALALATATIVIAYVITKARLGLGLFAIHDDEDAAEVMGVPTYRYKLVAFGISCALAGIAGGIHALFIQYVTAPGVFNITVPLTVILMSVLGGTRHWAGPALGATVITILLYASTAADQAIAGKAIVGAILVGAVLFMPDGILGRFARRRPVPASDAKPTAARAVKHHPSQGDAAASRRARRAQGVRRRARARRRRPRGPRRRDPRHARPQRLGQVDADQRRFGSLPRRRGKHRVRRPRNRLGAGAPHRACRRGAHLPDPRLFAHLDVRDNAALTAMFGGAQLNVDEAREHARTWLAFTGLAARADVLPGDLNLHQTKFLELARALASRPRLVLLDEVLSGLTPAEIDEAVAMILRIREHGTTVVLVEHVMRVVTALSDRLVVLDQGRVIAEGAPTDVMAHADVRRAYLGTAHA
jgi:branched-chain amino acid transport system permease protein